jgi:hypothetical protein
VVAPGEPEEVATTAKKSRSRNALAANWREERTALVSTYGCRLHGQRARAAPSKSFFDKAQARAKAAAEHLFGDQVPNQIFPIKTLASSAPRHGNWTMHKLLPREVLFQAVNSVDQWLKSMLISKR